MSLLVLMLHHRLANLFVTQNARLALEKKGVIL